MVFVLIFTVLTEHCFGCYRMDTDIPTPHCPSLNTTCTKQENESDISWQ